MKKSSKLFILSLTLLNTSLFVACGGSRTYALRSISDQVDKNQRNPPPHAKIIVDATTNQIELFNNCTGEHFQIFKIANPGDTPDLFIDLELSSTADCFRHVFTDTAGGLETRYTITPLNQNQMKLPKLPILYFTKDSTYFRRIEAE